MIAIALLMASCTVSDNPSDTPITPPEKEQAEYTLLFYGMGGGSNSGGSVLDGDIVAGNINDMIQAYGDFADKGNVVISYKFSPAFADSVYSQYTLADTPVEAGQKSFADYKGQTYRFALEKGKNIIESFANDKVYGPMESDYANPDSLTNFINWAVKEYPAKKYILVLSDHGGGYMPHYDLQYNKTRDIMNEATYGTSFSVHSLKYALQRANVHFDALYFDACLMNSLEYLYELKNQTDYFIASTFLVPGVGGDYQALLELLGSNDNLESALSQYPDRLVKFWDYYNCGNYNDVTVTRSSMLDAYGSVLKEFTSSLCDLYQNGTEDEKYIIESVTRNWTFRVLNSTSSYLLKNYVDDILSLLDDSFPQDLYYRYQSAHDNTIVSTATSPYFTRHDFAIDHSVLMGADGGYSKVGWSINEELWRLEPWYLRIYEKDGNYSSYYDFEESELKESEDVYDISDYLAAHQDDAFRGSWPSTFADTYCTLEFSKVTGWDRWLLTCQVHPFALSFADYELDFFGEYGDGDEEEESEEGVEAKLKAMHNYRFSLNNVKPLPEKKNWIRHDNNR